VHRAAISDALGVRDRAVLVARTLVRVSRKPSAPESRVALVRRARRINRELALAYPDAHTELDFHNPLELLVATVLSAQTTDKRGKRGTPHLFGKYPTAADYAAADRAELEMIIQSTGFFRNKATTLIKLGQALPARFGGPGPNPPKASC